MKFSGIAIPGYALDKSGKPVRSTKRMPVSKRIVQRKSKRVTPKRGKRLPEQFENRSRLLGRVAQGRQEALSKSRSVLNRTANS